MKAPRLALVLAAILMSGITASAQVTIAAWDTSGLTGATATHSATSSATNITGADLARGSGLGAASSSGTFSSNGFSNTDADDYVEFGFTVGGGFEVDLANTTLSTSTSNTGPGTLGLYWSQDSYAALLYTFNQSGESTVAHTIDLSSLSSVTGVTLFRILEIADTQADGVGPTTTSGAFRITALDVAGTVSAVPEASSFAVLAGLMMLGFAASRRRVRAIAA